MPAARTMGERKEFAQAKAVRLCAARPQRCLRAGTGALRTAIGSGHDPMHGGYTEDSLALISSDARRMGAHEH